MSAGVNGHAPEAEAPGRPRDPDSLQSRLRTLAAGMGPGLTTETAIGRLGLPRDKGTKKRVSTILSRLRSRGEIPARDGPAAGKGSSRQDRSGGRGWTMNRDVDGRPGQGRDPESLASRLRSLAAELGSTLTGREAVERLGLPATDVRRVSNTLSQLRYRGEVPPRDSGVGPHRRPRPYDPESAALSRIMAELGALEGPALGRAIRYLRERLDEAAEGGGQ